MNGGFNLPLYHNQVCNVYINNSHMHTVAVKLTFEETKTADSSKYHDYFSIFNIEPLSYNAYRVSSPAFIYFFHLGILLKIQKKRFITSYYACMYFASDIIRLWKMTSSLCNNYRPGNW